MNSPWGIRGVICERFGWTKYHLEHEIPWLDVHYMMIDQPKYIPPPDEPEGTPAVPGKPDQPAAPVTLAGKLNNFLNSNLE